MISGKDLKKEWGEFATQESPEAFHSIYMHYYHYLSYLGLKKGFGSEQVKDIINDVFLKLWEGRHKLQQVTHFHNYIVTIFLRTLFRQESADTALTVISAEAPDWLLSDSAEEQLIAREQSAQLHQTVSRHLERLPSRQRQMIYQKFFLNLSYAEIATANGVSVNTVYNTIYKTLDKLKSSINKELITVLIYLLFFFHILFSH